MESSHAALEKKLMGLGERRSSQKEKLRMGRTQLFLAE